jgi:hypothetical protein
VPQPRKEALELVALDDGVEVITLDWPVNAHSPRLVDIVVTVLNQTVGIIWISMSGVPLGTER